MQKKNSSVKAISVNNSLSHGITSTDIATPKDNITGNVSLQEENQTKYQSSLEKTDITHSPSSSIKNNDSKEIAEVMHVKKLSSDKTQDHNITDVISKIKAAVEKAKNYPVIARKNGIEGTVITGFYINHKGSPENIMVIKSSGFTVLDSAALQTIVKASPFPPIKENLEIPITFVLKK